MSLAAGAGEVGRSSVAGTGRGRPRCAVCPAKGLYQYAELIEGLICFLIKFFFLFKIEFFLVNG